jgi:hypothetical protein
VPPRGTARTEAVRAYWRELATVAPGLALPDAREWGRFASQGGPDGCTSCPDTIYGVPIGSSDSKLSQAVNYETREILLPCNVHDFRFWQGGGKLQFWACNIEFYQALLARVSVLPWPLSRWARNRCGIIYLAVSGPAGELHFNWKT